MGNLKKQCKYSAGLVNRNRTFQLPFSKGMVLSDSLCEVIVLDISTESWTCFSTPYCSVHAAIYLETSHILDSTDWISKWWPFYVVSECFPCIINTRVRVNYFRGFKCNVCLLHGCKIAAIVEKCLFVCPVFKIWPRLDFVFFFLMLAHGMNKQKYIYISNGPKHARHTPCMASTCRCVCLCACVCVHLHTWSEISTQQVPNVGVYSQQERNK